MGTGVIQADFSQIWLVFYFQGDITIWQEPKQAA